MPSPPRRSRRRSRRSSDHLSSRRRYLPGGRAAMGPRGYVPCALGIATRPKMRLTGLGVLLQDEIEQPLDAGATMTVRIEKRGKVWTVIHSRPEARNAMEPR